MSQRSDATKALLKRRRVPCICPQQHDGAKAETIDYSTARGVVIERVGCQRCLRTWSRNNTR